MVHNHASVLKLKNKSKKLFEKKGQRCATQNLLLGIVSVEGKCVSFKRYFNDKRERCVTDNVVLGTVSEVEVVIQR